MADAAAVPVAPMVTLLAALTQPDTNTIRQAEAELKPLLKNPACMMTLWQIVADTAQPNIAVRHVSAILLRKRLPSHYSHWEPAHKLEWQQNVLAALAAEQVRPVRSGLIGVAASLAQVEQQATPPFLTFLTAAANDPNARELCFLLLQEMTETVGMHWKPQVPDLQNFFSHVLHSPNEPIPVQKAAVQAIGQLMAFWADEPEIDSLAPLLPTLLQVARRTGPQADSDYLSAVLDVLYELAYSPTPSLMPYMPITIEFALECLRAKELELRVRDAAALVIATTAESKSKAFGRNEALMGAVLDTLFQLVQDSKDSAAGALFESNPAWKADLVENADDGDDDDFDSPTETSMAQGTLDMIACEVPKKFVWPACLSRCVDRLASPDPNARKAGIACLGVVAEGCSEPLAQQLPDIMPRVFAAAQDPEPAVRECACFCLGQISEHCQPDILQYSSHILPIVFQLLDDNNVAVQATSCYVLEMFCERLEPQAVRPLLDSLVRKLAHMLEVTTKRSVQEMAVAALAATAVAAEEEFTPYMSGVANLMTKLMQVTDPSMFSLRGRALECMGHMAIAVGRESFRPYFAATMQSAMEGLTTESTDLQEFAYAVFANLSKVMKEDFAPALPDLVPHLIKVIDMDEGQLEEASNQNSDYAGLDVFDDEDEEGGNAQYVLHVRTALLEVKKGAITALGEMAAHTGSSFCPHLEASMTVLQKSAQNWHPIIKAETADALPSLIIPSVAAYHNGELQWKKGDLNASVPLSQHTAALVNAVLTEELALMKDEDKTTVGKACEAVQSVIELCGPHALAPVASETFQLTHDLLARTSPCQTADALYSAEAPDEDDDDHDAFLQAACDLIGAFGRVLGAQFVPAMPQYLPLIVDYAKPTRNSSNRSMAMGCLGELAQEMEGAIAEHWQNTFLPAVLNGLVDEDPNVRRNTAFCAGLCCEHLKELAIPHYGEILNRMGPIFQMDATNDESIAAAMDNAAAALARMMMASLENVRPIEQVLPAFLQALPLKVDMSENMTVYTCLLGLLSANHAETMARKEDIKRIFAQATQEQSRVEPETKAKLVTALQVLQQ